MAVNAGGGGRREGRRLKVLIQKCFCTDISWNCFRRLH